MNVYEIKYSYGSKDCVVAKNYSDAEEIVRQRFEFVRIEKIELIASDVLMRKVDATYEDFYKTGVKIATEVIDNNKHLLDGESL